MSRLCFGTALGLTVATLLALAPPSLAQQLDMTPVESIQAAPPTTSDPAMPNMAAGMKPLTATVSKSLYLPPEMYGHWSVTGTLLKTNYDGFFSPVVNDIWILEREGDHVTISNPANGASATISVDAVDDNRATFHRQGPAGRNKVYQEIPTITVAGDRMVGRTVNKLLYLKDGQVVKELYGIYQLEAERINSGRTQFKPEVTAEGPDIQIEDVQIQR